MAASVLVVFWILQLRFNDHRGRQATLHEWLGRCVCAGLRSAVQELLWQAEVVGAKGLQFEYFVEALFPRCMSGHLACFFLYVVHHQSFEILMTPKAQPAAVWTADLYRLRHLPNLHWSAAMIRPLMMTRPDEVYNLNLMDLQLFAFFHFNFLPSSRFPAIDGIPSNDWHGALMHQTFRQALPSQKNSWSFNAVCVGLKGSFRVDLIHILFRTVWCILLGAKACTSGEEGPIWPRGFPVIWFKKLSSF